MPQAAEADVSPLSTSAAALSSRHLSSCQCRWHGYTLPALLLRIFVSLIPSSTQLLAYCPQRPIHPSPFVFKQPSSPPRRQQGNTDFSVGLLLACMPPLATIPLCRPFSPRCPSLRLSSSPHSTASLSFRKPDLIIKLPGAFPATATAPIAVARQRGATDIRVFNQMARHPA